ncbi:MAG: hypothetical protein JST12_13690 [Armatimonadetes bacterium]|nr:hypothetical protein [Armatimonadota bacterium]
MPMKSDVQVMATVCAVLFLAVRCYFDREQLRITWSEFGIFFIAMLYLCYANPEAWKDWSDVVRKTAAMILGFFVYLAAKLGYKDFSSRVVMWAAVVHLLAALAQAFAPSLHEAVVAPLMSQVRGAEDRGVGGACSEPSFLANIGVLLPILAWIIGSNGNVPMTKSKWRILWFIVLGLVALSQAATATIYGIVTLVVYSISKGFKSGLIAVSATAVCCFALVAAGPSLPKSRATELAQVVIANPRLIIEDPSASMRLVGHYLSGPSLLEKPFGNGEVKLDTDYFWFLWNKYDLDSWYEIDVSRMSGQYYALGYGLTDFGASCFRMGWFFIAILVYWLSQYRGTRYSATVIAFVALGVLSSIPIVFPAYWLLLGCVQAERERRENLASIPQTL